MISQFILLPACAYFLIIVFNIDPLHATGLLILACSPGGVTSNVFAYFCEGDLSLRYEPLDLDFRIWMIFFCS